MTENVVSAPWFSFAMFTGMLLCFALGRHLGPTKQSDEYGKLGAIDGAVFGLFGLLMAFSYSGAASRFDAHRQLIGEETNDIGTAYLRIDLLTKAAQPALRDSFRRYLDSRLETYRKLPNLPAAFEEYAKSMKIQNEIWKLAVDASADRAAHPDAGKLLLPAINEMIDITTTRMTLARLHPPIVIPLLLLGLGLVSSFLLGLNMAGSTRRSVAHVVGYAAVTVLTVFIILDLEYPRLGMIRADTYDKVLSDLRQSMNE